MEGARQGALREEAIAISSSRRSGRSKSALQERQIRPARAGWLTIIGDSDGGSRAIEGSDGSQFAYDHGQVYINLRYYLD